MLLDASRGATASIFQVVNLLYLGFANFETKDNYFIWISDYGEIVEPEEQ